MIYSIRAFHDTDAIWAGVPVALWAFAECTTVILAGAIPTIPRLIKSFSDSRPGLPSDQCVDSKSVGRSRTLKSLNDIIRKEGSRSGATLETFGTGPDTARGYIPLVEKMPRQVPQGAK